MFAGPIVFAAFIVTSSFAEETSSNDVAQEKRAPMGFQGMRGKKIVLGPDIGEDDFLSENSDKRSPSMGFQGMRGKKEYLVPIFEDPYYNEEYDKRAPMMGFQGMRGKKMVPDEDFNKRGPMGFQGVRGKKSVEEILEEIEKRASMRFHGTRGKKNYFVEYPEEYKKRAPMGFHGMRGKKNSLDEIQELQKRAIMGFQGVRGKRNVENSYETNSNMAERTALSFEGSMRDREDSAPYHFEKKAPFRYFGTRGKKNPRWEIRGKFVGVRGKKWETSSKDDRIQLKKLFDSIKRLNRLPGSTTVLEVQ